MGQGPEGEQSAVWHTRHERCENGACVEVSVQGERVRIRSTIAPDAVLALTRAEWQDFLEGAREGSFDSL